MLEAPAAKATSLVEVMISVAINGLYVSIIEDGLRLGEWRDADLAALGKQLRSVDLLPLVSRAFNTELVAVTHLAQTVPMSKMFDLEERNRFRIFDFLPRGWTYQNMVAYATMMERQIDAIESQLPLVAPRKVEQATESVETGLAASPLTSIGQESPYRTQAKPAKLQ